VQNILYYYALAQKNIQDSPYKDRIDLLPVAISHVTGEMSLHIDRANPHSNSLYALSPQSTYSDRITVSTWSLEQLLAYSGWNDIDLVKLDCEGAEYPILLKSPTHILQKVRRWVIEYHGEPESIEKKLQDIGYQVKRKRDSVLMGLIWAERQTLPKHRS